jgi:hypothetical protein
VSGSVSDSLGKPAKYGNNELLVRSLIVKDINKINAIEGVFGGQLPPWGTHGALA